MANLIFFLNYSHKKVPWVSVLTELVEKHTGKGPVEAGTGTEMLPLLCSSGCLFLPQAALLPLPQAAGAAQLALSA